MKWYRYYKAAAAVVLLVTAVLAWQNNSIWIIIGGTGVVCGTCFLLRVQRNAYEKQLIRLAEQIEGMLAGKPESQVSGAKDHLISRISHELDRLWNVTEGYRVKIEEDRDGVRSLISEIAHQLRMPLANIQTYVQMLELADITSEERQEYVNAIRISEEKLHFLTESFIRMSRMENRIIQLSEEETEIRETIVQAMFQIQMKAEAKDIDIRLHCEGDTSVLHDRNWMTEAVFNLLDNSVKYAESGSVVRVYAQRQEMFVQIRVRDYGPGIEKGEEGLIQQRFYRGAHTAGKEGFGIGLYIVREIMRKHEGFVKVKRETDGLSVSLYLPVKK